MLFYFVISQWQSWDEIKYRFSDQILWSGKFAILTQDILLTWLFKTTPASPVTHDAIRCNCPFHCDKNWIGKKGSTYLETPVFLPLTDNFKMSSPWSWNPLNAWSQVAHLGNCSLTYPLLAFLPHFPLNYFLFFASSSQILPSKSALWIK